MENLPVYEQSPQQLGEEWIRAVVEKDFESLAKICHPDVSSSLMTPKRLDVFENATDLSQKVEKWFAECDSINTEQTRIAMVGEKLAIFYRLSFEKSGAPHTAEQQIYCNLSDGRINRLMLLCSGFQPVQAPVVVPVAQSAVSASAIQWNNDQSSFQADAFLRVDTAHQGSTCAILTPLIKRKLGEIGSGQVLEVHVDDQSAQEDIEAWCRLSGNQLLKMDRGAGQDLRFYVMKK